MKLVKMNMKIRLYPSKVDINDEGEEIVSFDKIETNIRNAAFIWNKELEFINNFKNSLIQHGYKDRVKVNKTACDLILNMLRNEFPDLEKSESSSRQQVGVDLKTAFDRYNNPNLKSRYPRFKSKKNEKTGFRIMNNNNVRLQKNKYGGNRIKLAKLGLAKYKTSKEYEILLRQGSDPNDKSVTIKHVTVKKEHEKYYAIINIECMHPIVEKDKQTEQIGMDIGCGDLAVLSNKEIIPNLDLKHEVRQIKHYQREMSHHKVGSIRYRQAKALFHKWHTKLINKRNDYYNKQSLKIIKKSTFIAVQNENIIKWKKLKNLSKKLQINAPRKFMDMIEHKAHWNNIQFIKVPKSFASTQICSNCGEKNKNISGLGKIGIRNWKCPKCGKYHNRDINAAINILNKGLETVGTTVQ